MNRDDKRRARLRAVIRTIKALPPPPPRAKPTFSPRECEDCGDVFSPTGSQSRRCDPCKQPKPKAKPCRRCGATFVSESPRAKVCQPCKEPGGPPPIARQTCATCQHGYQYTPGEYGCAIQAAMRCKPALVSRQWMARRVMRAEASA